MNIIEALVEKIKGKNITIVYPEGTDKRIVGAAARHHKDGILKPILLGNKDAVMAVAKENGFDIEGITIYDIETYPEYEEMVEAFIERRNGKVDREKAEKLLRDNNYFGTMLIYMGKANGMVSGAVGTTGDTIRPALQIIKTKPGTKIVSGAMLMVGPNDERYLFADIAVNIEPKAEELADIAHTAEETARAFGIDEPKVAMLSFSTMGSAHSDGQEMMAEATRIAKERYPEMAVDGEMQFDAALIPAVGERKAPNSKVAGHANVFIFPDIAAGNIAYKVAERLGGYRALGPILQGIAKPVNDLSRGCSENDAYELAILTAVAVED